MDDVKRIVQKDREALRWRVLNAAYNASTFGLSDSLALRISKDAALDVELERVRKAFDYLEGKGVLECSRRDVEWICRITNTGIDVVEGNLVCPPGIDRPEW